MEPPDNVEVLELPASTMWMDKNGILVSVSKKHPPQTIEEARRSIEALKKITNGRKVCMLIDITNSTPPSKELRDFTAKEIPELVKAVALISGSPLGKMIANLFFGLKPPTYPAKMFNEEQEARQWLKQYL